MYDKLRSYVEDLFKNAPQTKQVVEVKEEILQNTIDRYNDLIEEGKSPEAAFNISVAGIGDVDKLLACLMAPTTMSGYSREEIDRNKQRRSILLSIAIALYICCIIPPIILDELFGGRYEYIGAVLMFLIIALATGILIYRGGISLHYDKSDQTVVEDFKQWNREKKEDSSVMRAISAVLTCIMLVFYFLISFSTGAWHITWLIFPIFGAIHQVINAIRDLVK